MRSHPHLSLASRTLVVIGDGRLGGAVHRTGAGAGLRISLADRGGQRAACASADAVLLCVPDGEIESACEAVVGGAGRSFDFVGHTSGATGLGALTAAAAANASIFSLHPLQSVPGPDSDLGGAPAAIEASDDDALAYATQLAAALGMRPFELPPDSRAAYHAAASIASNFLVTLEESAAELMSAAGIDDARRLLAPLVLQTARNWADSGPEALTGPIARGDEATVERHLEAIAAHAPHLEELYRGLAGRTRAIAARREGVPA